MENWLTAPISVVAVTALTVLLIYFILITVTKTSGLRTFAKMTSVDFVSTIAIGSILGILILNKGQSLLKAVIAIITLIIFQAVLSYLMRKNTFFQKLFTNQPLLLMKDGEILEIHLRKANLSRE